MTVRKKDDWNGCPIRYFSGLVGDPWSLLILRDMMFNGARRYGEFQNSPERIATNILANRLKRLEETGFISRQTAGRHAVYALTERGRSLLPVMLSIVAWGAENDNETEVTEQFLAKYKAAPDAMAAEMTDAILARDWELLPGTAK